MSQSGKTVDLEKLTQNMREAMRGRLPELFGIELTRVEPGALDARLELRPEHLAPNDFLHAATVVALADSAAGMGCLASLPENASGFTTVELKTNFLRTAKTGALACSARLRQGGSRIQVWDCDVVRETDGETIALFRCTQMLLGVNDERTARQQEQVKKA